MKKSSFRAQTVNRTFCSPVKISMELLRVIAPYADEVIMYLIGVVKVEQLRPVLVDLLVTHPPPSHR